MLSLQSTYIHLCPNLLQLAEVCLTLPVSNAWPERGASAIKRLKTRLRSNLKNDMLTSLLQIAVNGSDTSDCHHVIEEAMKEWLSKPRRKIAKYTDKQKEVTKFQTVDASVQVESQSDLDKIHSAYKEAQEDLEEDMTRKCNNHVENIAALLKLPCFLASDDSEDSDSDCYTNSDLELLE